MKILFHRSLGLKNSCCLVLWNQYPIKHSDIPGDGRGDKEFVGLCMSKVR